jgi:hypothetical protein
MLPTANKAALNVDGSSALYAAPTHGQDRRALAGAAGELFAGGFDLEADGASDRALACSGSL